jgi:Tfp pilus assembly protein PilF
MSSRALLHYRKAELCLRRGDLRDAVLQLKMAIAADPQSTLLRTALAEVEVEVGKKP